MKNTEELRLRDLARPAEEHAGRLVSIEGTTAVLELPANSSIAARALVEFRTPHTLHLGEVTASRHTGQACEIRVQLEHVLDVAAVKRIQRVWTPTPSE